MNTSIHEIADGIYRLSTSVPDAAPGGFTFNQFLVDGDEPLLFHTGPRQLFPLVSAAAAKVIELDRLRWITFGHDEADECGAMNLWLDLAPRAEVAHTAIGCAVTIADRADRPPRPLADGEVLDIGGHRLRSIATPHVPHGWDAHVLLDETTSTLFCGDLFTQTGDGPALVHDADIVGPALAAEDVFGATCLTPTTAPTMRRLADLAPRTLGLMHGPSYAGDGRSVLLDLAGAYAGRLASAYDATLVGQ